MSRKKIPRKLILILSLSIVLIATFLLLGWHNYTAEASLIKAQKQDQAGNYASARQALQSIRQILLLPSLQSQIKTEQSRNAALIDNNTKLQRVQELLRQHNPEAALSLLKTLQNTSAKAASSQIAALQQQALQQNASPTPSPVPKPGTPSPTPTRSPAPTSTPAPTPTPPPPGPMSAIAVTAFSATSSPYNATSCALNQSVTFTTNGSGSVAVVWKVLSTKTSSYIDNPVVYNFSAAGSKTDAQHDTAQGLEAGDSYRVSVTITSQANGAITTTAGPTVISSCAAPQALHQSLDPPYMSTITPGTLSSSNSQDGIFTNECSMVLQAPFSVNGSGSVEAVYTITSGSSGGATLYASTTHDFTVAGSDTDTSYIRMPHLNGGDMYSITVRLIEVDAQNVYATAGPITSGCL